MIVDRFLSEAQIESRAYRVLQRYGIQYGPITNPPIPVERIIDLTMNLPLVWEPVPHDTVGPVLAKLVVKRPCPEIVVNEDCLGFFEEHDGTEQYSLAHELGHFVLHVDTPALNSAPLEEIEERTVVLCRAPSAAKPDRKEWQAERFAAYLLMPRDMVRRCCADVDVLQWSNLYQLRQQFRVSITALCRRLSELQLVRVTSDRKLVPFGDLSTNVPSLWG